MPRIRVDHPDTAIFWAIPGWAEYVEPKKVALCFGRWRPEYKNPVTRSTTYACRECGKQQTVYLSDILDVSPHER